MNSIFENKILIYIVFAIFVLLIITLFVVLIIVNKKIKNKKTQLDSLSEESKTIINDISNNENKLENDKKIIDIIKKESDKLSF